LVNAIGAINSTNILMGILGCRRDTRSEPSDCAQSEGFQTGAEWWTLNSPLGMTLQYVISGLAVT